MKVLRISYVILVLAKYVYPDGLGLWLARRLTKNEMPRTPYFVAQSEFFKWVV